MTAYREQEQLVQSALKGDRTSCQSIVSQHERLVAQIVGRIIRRPDDRPDVAQEIFLKVFQHLASFEYNSKLSTWIAKVAFNTCIHHVEKKRAELFSDTSDEERTIDEVFTGPDSPGRTVESRQLSGHLAEEIDALPVLPGTVISLYHFHDMTYQEIGDILQLPIGTIKSYLFRGRKLLKDRLLQRFAEEDLCA